MSKRTEAKARVFFNQQETKRTDFGEIKRRVIDAAVSVFVSDPSLNNLVHLAYHFEKYSIDDIDSVLKAFLQIAIQGRSEEIARSGLSGLRNSDQKSQQKLFDEFKKKAIQAKLINFVKEVKAPEFEKAVIEGQNCVLSWQQYIGPWIIEGLCQSQEFKKILLKEEIPCLDESRPLIYIEVDKIIALRGYSLPVQSGLNNMIEAIRLELVDKVKTWPNRKILLEHDVTAAKLALFTALTVFIKLTHKHLVSDNEGNSVSFTNLPTRSGRMSLYLPGVDVRKFELVVHPNQDEVIFINQLETFIADQLKQHLEGFMIILMAAAKAAVTDIRQYGGKFASYPLDEALNRILGYSIKSVERSYVEFQKEGEDLGSRKS